MPMQRVSARDFQARPGEWQSAAHEAPIVITNHGRDEFVLMSMRTFERYQKLDTRRSLTVDELPEELKQELLQNMKEYQSGDPVLDELYERSKKERAGKPLAHR
jgi:prevent-host-death family protein